MVNPPPTSDQDPTGHPWLARRRDQLAVALLIALGLAGIAIWWIAQGGLQGRLGELDRAKPQTAAFEVDVNSVEWPELAQLPGIGPVLAKRIVESRSSQGPFRSVEDLRRVRGVGPLTLERIRPYLRPLPAK
jgi:competence protein ComEA